MPARGPGGVVVSGHLRRLGGGPVRDTQRVEQRQAGQGQRRHGADPEQAAHQGELRLGSLPSAQVDPRPDGQGREHATGGLDCQAATGLQKLRGLRQLQGQGRVPRHGSAQVVASLLASLAEEQVDQVQLRAHPAHPPLFIADGFEAESVAASLSVPRDSRIARTELCMRDFTVPTGMPSTCPTWA